MGITGAMASELSLGTRLSVLVLLAVILPAGARVALDYVRGAERIGAIMQARAENAASALDGPLHVPLSNLDKSAVKELLDSFGRDSSFVGIEVADPKRNFVVSSRFENVVRASYVATREMSRDGVSIGTVSVTLTDEPEFARMFGRLREDLVVALVQSALALIAVNLAVRAWVRRPTEQLVGESRRMAEGRLDESIGGVEGLEFGALASALDDTRRATKRSLRDLAAQLEERSASLARARRDLQSAMRQLLGTEKQAAVGNLVAGVAHELNTPLGNVLMLASSLEERVEQLGEQHRAGTLRKSTMEQFLDDSQDAARLIVKNAERAAKLVIQFKGVAIDQSSNRRMHFDLAEVVESALDSLRPSLGNARIRISLGIPSGIVMDGYPGAIEGIVINSVMNAAIHAFPDDQAGNIALSTEQPTPERVRLTVGDDGCGMSVEVRARIFEPFFTTKLGHGGSGLGLYLVQNLVSGTLGGDVTVESSPGKGTRFHFDMPLVAPRSEIQTGTSAVRAMW